GLLPAVGETGASEWSGFLPTSELPQVFNPPQHYVATANHNILPRGYPHQLGYEWTAPFRFGRVDQVLRAGKKVTVEVLEKLQHHAPPVEAEDPVALPKPAPPGGGEARKLHESWNGVLSKHSAAAMIYELWAQRVIAGFIISQVPADLRPLVASRMN